MKLLRSREAILAIFTVHFFVICQPIWAMSCSDNLLGEAESSNVIKVDFRQRRQPRAQPATINTQESMGSVKKFEFPSLKNNSDTPHNEHHFKVVEDALRYVSWYKKYVESKIKAEQLNTISQNDVWLLHAGYINFTHFLRYFADPKNGYDKETSERVEKAYAELDDLIKETNFFEDLQSRGLTLVPQADELVKDPLPSNLIEAQLVMSFRLQMVDIAMGHLNNMDAVYGDTFRQRLLNGADRENLFKVLAEYLESFNPYLREVKNSVDVPTTDISQITKLIKETEYLLSLVVLKRAINFALKSLFPKTKQLVIHLNQLIEQFNVVAYSIKHPNMSHLQVAEVKVQNGITDSDVTQLATDLEQIIVSSSTRHVETYFIEWQGRLASFREKIYSADDLRISKNSKNLLIQQLNIIKEAADEYPENYSRWRGIHTKDEINAANQARKDVDFLFSLLAP